MIWRTKEGEIIRKGINLDWWHSSTIFRFILEIPLYKSCKFYKEKEFDTKNLCLMRGQYFFRFYFRIRHPFIIKKNYIPFVIETGIHTKPYYSKIIATREQLRNNIYA